jgi:integrase
MGRRVATRDLTKTEVDKLVGAEKDFIRWDAQVRGFGVRVTPRNSKTFVAQYRVGSQPKREKIGTYPEWTVDQARQRAKEIIQRAQAGKIGTLERKDTVAMLWTKFKHEYVALHCKPRTQVNYEGLWSNHIERAIGSKPALGIIRNDITRLFASLTADGKKQTANLVVNLIGAMFQWAIAEGLLPDDFRNPTARLERNRIAARDKAPSVEELARIFEAINALEDLYRGITIQTACALRILALTGARLREIIHAEWDWVQFETITRDGVSVERAVISLPDSKTGAKTVILAGPAVEVLKGVPKVKGNPYCFPGLKPGTSLQDISKAWRRVCKAAGLPSGRDGYTIHDLRHAYATLGASINVPLAALGKALGHSQERMTARYTNPSIEAARAAADQVGARFAELGNVIPLRRAS